MKLTESQLKQLVRESLEEMIDEDEIEEGWLGNMFKAGAQTVGNKVGKAYNDFAGRMNQMNASDASAQADQMDKEVEALPAQIKQQVKAYRSQLMRELNAKVHEYEGKLKSDLQAKQDKAISLRDKAQGYANKAANNQARYDQLHANAAGRQAQQGGQMVAESKIDRIVRQVIKENLK